MMNSKYLDFLDWSKCYNIILNKDHFKSKDSEGILKLKEFKSGMNLKRTYLDRSHLKEMYTR